jgi:hypothetical protein
MPLLVHLLLLILRIRQPIRQRNSGLGEAVIFCLVSCHRHCHPLRNGLICLGTEHDVGDHVHTIPIQILVLEGLEPDGHGPEVTKSLPAAFNGIACPAVLQSLDPSFEPDKHPFQVLEIPLNVGGPVAESQYLVEDIRGRPALTRESRSDCSINPDEHSSSTTWLIRCWKAGLERDKGVVSPNAAPLLWNKSLGGSSLGLEGAFLRNSSKLFQIKFISSLTQPNECSKESSSVPAQLPSNWMCLMKGASLSLIAGIGDCVGSENFPDPTDRTDTGGLKANKSVPPSFLGGSSSLLDLN